MIILKAELFQGLDTPAGLRAALQNAIMLEHATIPPYLYAFYTLQGSENLEVAHLIRSVVIEEMGHMAVACNILNAIGGQPILNQARFVPTYPGPLPGGVESGLTVTLARFSLRQVHDVFMAVEEPENPLIFQLLEEAAPPQTIGMFYQAIERQLVRQSRSGNIFTGDSSRQVTDVLPGLIEVTDLPSAQEAIATIIRQGEGTTTDPLDAQGDPAHYYRFAEIYHGRKLIPVEPSCPPGTPPEQCFVYGGDPVTFDAGAVLPVVENPRAADYPPGSAARKACDDFNAAYTDLLNTLHQGFNGDPDSLGDAVGDMFTLSNLALAVMEIDLGNGQNAGPSFEFNPSTTP